MNRLPLAVFALLLAAGSAHAEPIFTPILTIVSAAQAIGTITIFGVSIASIAGSLALSAIGIGLSLLLQKRPTVPKPEDGNIPFQQPLPFRTGAYGTVRFGGAIMLKEEWSGYYLLVTALCAHRIDEFVQIYLNDDPVMPLLPATTPTPGDNTNLVAPFASLISTDTGGRAPPGADSRYYGGGGYGVFLDTRKGEVPETFYEALNYNVPDTWTTSHRGDGIASMMMIATAAVAKEFTKTYPYGPPQPSAVFRSARLYDPRNPAHDREDEDTWTFETNAALGVLHFLCFSPFGPRLNYDTAIAPVLDDWLRAIDDCDALVPKKVGTERRYQIGGFTYSAEQDRKVNIQALLACCDGWLLSRGDGAVVLDVGVYREPQVVITDADILGVDLNYGSSSMTRINQSTARFTSPANGYVSVETRPLIDLEDQQRRHGPPRTSVVDLTPVHAIGQVSRLHKREFIRQQSRIHGTLTCNWGALPACYERWVRVQSNTLPGLSDQVIEIRRPTIHPSNGTCELEFIALGAEIEDYDPATDEADPPTVPTRPATTPLLPPDDIDVIAEQITTGTTTTIYLEASWADPFDGEDYSPYTTYAVRWRPTTATSWSEAVFSGLQPSGGRYSAQTGAVLPGVTIEAQVAAVGPGGNYSSWSEPPNEVSTEIVSVAPSSPIGLVATGGSGSVSLSATAPNSPNVDAVRFSRSAVGAGFALSIPVGTVFVAPNATAVMSDTGLSAGSYDYFAVAINAYDTASTPIGPETATVT